MAQILSDVPAASAERRPVAMLELLVASLIAFVQERRKNRAARAALNALTQGLRYV